MIAQVRHPAGPRSANRLFEWITSASMILMALTIALPGDTLDRGVYRVLLTSGITEATIGVVVAVTGAMRCVALFANGNLPYYGPILRWLGSWVGAFFWASICVPLVNDSMATGAASMFVPLLGSLAMGELISMHRAVRDGRLQWRRPAQAIPAFTNDRGWLGIFGRNLRDRPRQSGK